jgi:hypothetical protein
MGRSSGRWRWHSSLVQGHDRRCAGLGHLGTPPHRPVSSIERGDRACGSADVNAQRSCGLDKGGCRRRQRSCGAAATANQQEHAEQQADLKYGRAHRETPPVPFALLNARQARFVPSSAKRCARWEAHLLRSRAQMGALSRTWFDLSSYIKRAG